MNWEAIGAVGEIAGAIAVIATLVYLAVQIKDSARAGRSAAANDANMAMQSWYLQIGSNQQISELWNRAITSEVALSNQEEFQYLMMTHAAFLGFQNSYLLAEEGTIDPELRESITSAILGIKDLPGMTRYWRQRRRYLHKDFAEYVDELLTSDAINTVDIYHMPEVKPEQ